MKFTIDHGALKKLLKAVVSRSEDAHAVTKEDTIVLSAYAGRVFVECKGDVAGIEALVLEEGAVTLPARKFRTLLKTYKGTRSLTFDGSADGLRVQTFWMPVVGYDPHPKPAAEF